MTSDAKVGLLLGLVFIVTIAFLINGLPGLLSKGSSKVTVDPAVRAYRRDLGIADKTEGAFDRVNEFDPLKIKKQDLPIKDDTRFEDNKPVAKRDRNNSSDKKSPVSKKKFYIVKDGDNLGKIAIKYYGKELGNKQATVNSIFQANSNILTSPDDISINQKLIMPSLGGDKKQSAKNGRVTVRKSGSSKEDELMKTGIFEKVGRSFKEVFAKKGKPSSLSVYVVKDDDNLWNIASKRLGSGTRWPEIQKINSGILKGSTVVDSGMKLKIPQI